jgi:peroxiredoxin
MTNLNQLPDDLPVPEDDGGADHLKGKSFPKLALKATNGDDVDLSAISGRVVVYCYPMTGRPDRELPEGWNEIPGARGCTPQSCSYRDHYQELQSLGAKVFGLSVQMSEYQQEMVDRLHLPFLVLSDASLEFQKALNLPTFTVSGMRLLKRITFIAEDGVIQAVHYPIFPSDSDPSWVINYLSQN